MVLVLTIAALLAALTIYTARRMAKFLPFPDAAMKPMRVRDSQVEAKKVSHSLPQFGGFQISSRDISFLDQAYEARKVPQPIALYFLVRLVQSFGKHQLNILMHHLVGLWHGNSAFKRENMLSPNAIGFLCGLSPTVFQRRFRGQHCQQGFVEAGVSVLFNPREDEIGLAGAFRCGPVGEADATCGKDSRQMMLKRISHAGHPRLQNTLGKTEKALHGNPPKNEWGLVWNSRGDLCFHLSF